jgi:hypothetical protein
LFFGKLGFKGAGLLINMIITEFSQITKLQEFFYRGKLQDIVLHKGERHSIPIYSFVPKSKSPVRNNWASL